MKTQQWFVMAGLIASVLLAGNQALAQKGVEGFKANKQKNKPKFQVDQGGADSSGVLKAKKDKNKPKYQLNQDGTDGLDGTDASNFEPSQMPAVDLKSMPNMIDSYRDLLEVTNDGEWAVIRERIQKVLDVRREMGFDDLGARVRRPSVGNGSRSGLPGSVRLLGAPNSEEDALQKLIDSNGSNADLKAALARVQDARKAKQPNLEAALEELRKVLSRRQEAIATRAGLL